MGVDVNLYVEGTVTDERLDLVNQWLMERGVHGYDRDFQDDRSVPPLRRDDYFDRLEWDTLDRYYGPGYPRGWWPTIHNAIVCIRAALPDCEVFYGGDTTDYGTKATDDYLAEIWALWTSDAGRSYFRDDPVRLTAE